jgi:hypothetical protein
MGQQTLERRAKQDVRKILNWIRTGALTSAGLIRAEMLLKDRLGVLRLSCGLKDSYYEAVFGFLDDAWLARVRDVYRPGQDNAAMLQRSLTRALAGRTVAEAAARRDVVEKRIEHPWLKSGTTVWDYLEYEDNVRKGTFDEVKLSDLTLNDLNKIPQVLTLSEPTAASKSVQIERLGRAPVSLGGADSGH